MQKLPPLYLFLFVLQVPEGVDTATLLCNMSDIICISEKLLGLLEASVKNVEFEKQIIGKLLVFIIL